MEAKQNPLAMNRRQCLGALAAGTAALWLPGQASGAAANAAAPWRYGQSVVLLGGAAAADCREMHLRQIATLLACCGGAAPVSVASMPLDGVGARMTTLRFACGARFEALAAHGTALPAGLTLRGPGGTVTGGPLGEGLALPAAPLSTGINRLRAQGILARAGL